MKVPPDFTNTDLTIVLTVKPQSKADKNELKSTGLVDEGGILVADGELLDDITDVVQQDRERRIEELLQRTGL